MARSLSPEKRIVVIIAAVVLLVAAVLLAGAIPPVEGLGDKVRLPIFHGGSTWVNLATFTLMGLAGLVHWLTGRPDAYRWASGFLFVSAPLWIINTVLGVIAAMRTWDFSGSRSAPIAVIREDPRLTAQFQLLMLLLVMLVLIYMFENRRLRAAVYTGYAIVMWGLLGSVFLNPRAQALHPDSPVLNSALDIQLPFFGIVGSIFVAACLIAWFWRDHLLRND